MPEPTYEPPPEPYAVHECDGTCLPRDPWAPRGRHEARRYKHNPRAVGRHEDFSGAYWRLINTIQSVDTAACIGLISESERRRRILTQLEQTPLPPAPR